MDSRDGVSLRTTMRDALTTAMKQRDRVAVRALRAALAAIDNAEAVDPSHAPREQPGTIAGGVAGLGAGEIPRHALSDDDVRAIVQTTIADLHTAAADYDRLHRAPDADLLRAEAAVLSKVCE
ncbi:MAG TPA: hypothetical protein VFZ83_13230 [Acidimicrobiia bacterium]|nr:hypothetical protein [Acidimicrobiia bacterium]